MSLSLDTAIATLLTNRRRVSALKALGVVSVRDALTYYPFRVTDPVPLLAVREAKVGSPMAFAAVVRALRVVPMNARRGYRLEAVVDDAQFAASRGVARADARLVFFSYKKSYVDWVSMRLRSGATVVVAGEPSEFNGQLQFTHPEILTVAPGKGVDGIPGQPGASGSAHGGGGTALKYDADSVDEALSHVSRPRPVYHANSRISSEHIHETIVGLLGMLAEGASDVVGPSDTDASPDVNVRSDATGLSDATESKGSGTADDPSAVGKQTAGERLAKAVPDVLPETVRAERGLLHRAEAFLAVHEPETVAAFQAGIDTLRYEEAFVSQTALLRARHDSRQAQAWACPLNEGGNGGIGGRDVADGKGGKGGKSDGRNLRDRFIDSLPFELTDGQRRIIDDIAADMARDHPMQRLLQGEVGSGKTVVALAAMLQAVGAGRQAVLVAPTQVLAEQHHATISRMVASVDDTVPVILLTGGMKLAARRKALASAASGEPCIIVATHAAFSKTFQAPNLALAVIDEQHRFGVEQRETLRERGERSPHLLVMTATPIPRTAAMTWFGDLDISWLTELPGGRKPIRTVVVNEADGGTMARMFSHIRARIDAGERAYIVCARIDDSEEGTSSGRRNAPDAMDPGDVAMTAFDPYDASDGHDDDRPARPPLHTVAEIAGRLAKLPQFAGVAFATLTGRDDSATKQQVMAGFADGATPVLVATTVIEVGVDVPQASCIVIFDSDRYGLSQLHQLRGRVGRGGTDSWAFLVSRAEPGSQAEARLEVIHHSLDGAEIAQADLEFRGAGDVLGDAQSGGKSGLKLLRVVKDADLIADARSRAEALLADDPELAGQIQLSGAVLDFTRGNETFLTSS